MNPEAGRGIETQPDVAKTESAEAWRNVLRLIARVVCMGFFGGEVRRAGGSVLGILQGDGMALELKT